MQESFKQVDYVITQFVQPAQSVPALVGSGAVSTYTEKVLAEFAAASSNKEAGNNYDAKVVIRCWVSRGSVYGFTQNRLSHYI